MAKESGLRPIRLDSVREDSDGSIPASNDVYPFASVVNSVEWTPDKNTDAKRGVGGPDPVGFNHGKESHELTINHDLEGTVGTTEGTKNAAPVGEAMTRDADNKIPYQRTIVQREIHDSDGAMSSGMRLYTVARHCKPDVNLSGESESGDALEAELTYQAEKIRKYRIDQPSTATSLTATSTVSEAGTVTIEDDDGTQESISLTAGSGTGTTSFASIDAIHLDDEFDGDVSIEAGGTTLCTIKGANSYGSIEGDRGVPVTPSSGTRFTSFDGAANKLLGATAQWAGVDIAPELENIEIGVENNYDNYAGHDKFGQTIEEGNRDITVSASLVGEKQSEEKIMSYLQRDAGSIDVKLGPSTVTVTGAELTDPGNDTREEGQVFAAMDCEFSGTGISI